MKTNPFTRLLGLQRKPNARERLMELRNKYALTENDPVWELVAVVEDFCADLQAEAADRLATVQLGSAPDTSSAPTSSDLTRWRVAVLGSAAAAAQTLLLAGSFALGAGAVQHARANLLIATLTVPVGWVAFALLLPLLGALTYLGWRSRRTEPAIGWTLTLVGLGASCSTFMALWRLLEGT